MMEYFVSAKTLCTQLIHGLDMNNSDMMCSGSFHPNTTKICICRYASAITNLELLFISIYLCSCWRGSVRYDSIVTKM